MKNFQKIILTAIAALIMNLELSAAVSLDISAGNAEMDGVITGPAKVIGAHVLTLKNQTSALTALEIANGQNVAASDCSFSETDVTISTADGGALTQAAGMTLRSLTLSAAGEVASTNAAIVLTTATPGAHILTTASGTGGTTIGTLATGSSTTTIANSDALIINASSGSGNIALSGNANGTTIAGALASSGGLNSSAGNVVLASGDSVTASVAAMPTGSSVISGTAVLALGAYGPADAMFATAFTDTAKLTVPANVAAASINGAVSFASGCSAHCADTAGVNLLDTIGSMKFIHGSSIVFVAGSKWGTPITSAVS